MDNKKSKKTGIKLTPRERIRKASMPNRSTIRTKTYLKTLIDNPNMSKFDAKLQAGFAPSTSTAAIESTDIARQIRGEIEAACRKHKAGPEDCVQVLADVMHDTSKSSQSERVNSVKVLAGIAGYNAPIVQEINEQRVEVSVLLSMIKRDGVSMSEILQNTPK